MWLQHSTGIVYTTHYNIYVVVIMKFLARCVYILCLAVCVVCGDSATWIHAKIIVAEANTSAVFKCDSHPGQETVWRKRSSSKNLPHYSIDKQGWTEKINDAKHAEQQSSSHRRHRHSPNAQNSTTTTILHDVNLEDSGNWICTEKSSSSSFSQDVDVLDTATLLVLPALKRNKVESYLFLQEGGTLLLSNKSVLVVQEGESLSLICVTTGTQVSVSVDGNAISGGQHFESNNMLFRAVDVSVDRSMRSVECGSGGAAISLDIHYPPSFTIRREPVFGIPVLEGMTVGLECDVDSRPITSRTRWLKNEIEYSGPGGLRDNRLILDNVGSQDAGWYQCTTLYKGETYSSIGYFLNVQSPTLSEVESRSSSNKTKANKGTLKAAAGLNLTEEKAPLEIANNVLFEDNCFGCCTSEENKAAQINPYPEIRLVNGTRSEMQADSATNNVTLSVEVCANPPVHRIIWETPEGVLLKPGQSTGRESTGPSWRSSPTCVSANLTIVRLYQTASWHIVAQNSHGFGAEKALKVTVSKRLQHLVAASHNGVSKTTTTNLVSCLLIIIIIIIASR